MAIGVEGNIGDGLAEAKREGHALPAAVGAEVGSVAAADGVAAGLGSHGVQAALLGRQDVAIPALAVPAQHHAALQGDGKIVRVGGPLVTGRPHLAIGGQAQGQQAGSIGHFDHPPLGAIPVHGHRTLLAAAGHPHVRRTDGGYGLQRAVAGGALADHAPCQAVPMQNIGIRQRALNLPPYRPAIRRAGEGQAVERDSGAIGAAVWGSIRLEFAPLQAIPAQDQRAFADRPAIIRGGKGHIGEIGVCRAVGAEPFAPVPIQQRAALAHRPGAIPVGKGQRGQLADCAGQAGGVGHAFDRVQAAPDVGGDGKIGVGNHLEGAQHLVSIYQAVLGVVAQAGVEAGRDALIAGAVGDRDQHARFADQGGVVDHLAEGDGGIFGGLRAAQQGAGGSINGTAGDEAVRQPVAQAKHSAGGLGLPGDGVIAQQREKVGLVQAEQQGAVYPGVADELRFTGAFAGHRRARHCKGCVGGKDRLGVGGLAGGGDGGRQDLGGRPTGHELQARGGGVAGLCNGRRQGGRSDRGAGGEEEDEEGEKEERHVFLVISYP